MRKEEGIAVEAKNDSYEKANSKVLSKLHRAFRNLKLDKYDAYRVATTVCVLLVRVCRSADG